MSAAVQSGLDNTRVSAYWDQQFAKIRADNSCWINNGIVAANLYRLISGGSEKYWLHWLLEDYFRDVPAFGRSFSICCGDGSHELMLHNSKKVKFVRGFDISEGAIRQANEKLRQAGAAEGSYLFEVKDANNLDVEDRFDLVLSTGALHHVTELEGLLDKVHALLRPDGYFVLLEFVGPNRFQWTARQCELINGAAAQLDPHYLRGGVRGVLSPPPVEEMLRIDPSEAVRSEDIVPLVRDRFRVEYEKAFNGTLMHMLYPMLNADLANRGGRDFDSIVRLLLYFEDVLVRGGLLPSDFVFMICRSRSHTGGGPVRPSAESRPGPAAADPHYAGFVEVCTPAFVAGWAADLRPPNAALFVDVCVDDRRLGQVLCDGYRKDVRDAGYGNGLCGFAYAFPPSCRPAPGSRVRVFVSGTDTLVGSGTVAAAA
jgi:SAM-dependent methyltransferase